MAKPVLVTSLVALVFVGHPSQSSALGYESPGRLELGEVNRLYLDGMAGIFYFPGVKMITTGDFDGDLDILVYGQDSIVFIENRIPQKSPSSRLPIPDDK